MVNQNNTYMAGERERRQQWWLIDAEGQTLGRLASRIAVILRGKHRPTYSPHQDSGDHVVVVNAEKVAVTGAKVADKRYYRHSGYPGGLREKTLATVLATHPERALRFAVHGMLPRGRMRRQLLGKLKIYAGPNHPHRAQNPVALVASGTAEENVE